MKIHHSTICLPSILLVAALVHGQAIAGECIATAKADITASEYNGEDKECFMSIDIKGKAIELCPAVFPKGESRIVSQKWINSATKINTLCFHGDSCYPASGFTLQGNCNSPNIAILSD
jgi:hypothetical protein